MKIVLFTFVILISSICCFSQEKHLVFTDNSSLKVIATNLDQKPTTIFSNPNTKIIRKEFTAILTGIGKAYPPINKKTERAVNKKNRLLVRQIARITSAYNLTQNDYEYYFAGLNSISYAKFSNCSAQMPCQVKFQSIIIQTKDKLNEENILIITSMKISK
jgi:hypothetical protein